MTTCPTTTKKGCFFHRKQAGATWRPVPLLPREDASSTASKLEQHDDLSHYYQERMLLPPQASWSNMATFFQERMLLPPQASWSNMTTCPTTTKKGCFFHRKQAGATWRPVPLLPREDASSTANKLEQHDDLSHYYQERMLLPPQTSWSNMATCPTTTKRGCFFHRKQAGATW